MSSRVKIADICTRICSGGTPKSGVVEFYENGKIPWLNTGEINFNRIRHTNSYITEAGLASSSAKWISKNSISIAMYGATAGKAAVVKIPLTTNQACCNLEVNESVAVYRFVYYWLQSNYSKLANLANGGAQQNLSAKTIKALEIDLPPMPIQRSVAEVLSQLDDKLELNNRLNDYLAEMGTALFNNVAPQSNAPNAALSDIAEITMGQSPSGSSYNEEGSGEVFYQGRAEFGSFFPRRRLFTTEPKRMAQEGDTLMSVRAPVGDLNIANEKCCIGRGLAAIHSDTFQSFTHYLLRGQSRQLDAFNGDGTVFGSINGKALRALPIYLPTEKEINEIETELKSLDAMIRNNDDEIRLLEQLRDTLLPKLMAGEIDVSEINFLQS